MNPTLFNPKTNTTATPLPNVTPEQQSAALAQGFTIPSTITSKDLQGGTQAINLPQQTSGATTQNLAMATNSAISSAAGDASYTPPEPAKIEQVSVMEKIRNMIPGLTTQARDIETIQSDAGLLAKKQKAIQLSTEADQMDKAYRDEIKQVKDTFQGTTGGLQAEINRITDRYQNNRANLALTYKVAAEDYQGAQEIVNQKIQTLKDTNAMNVEMYKLAVDAIRNDLTESEKMKAQANLTAKQKQADVVNNAYADTLKALQSSGQNVPASVYSAVDTAARKPNATAADIYAAAGNYAVDLYKQAQTAKLLDDTKYATDITSLNSPLVNAIVNVNAGSAEGQQKRDALRIAQFVQNGQEKEAKELILSRVTSKMSAGEREAELDRRNTIDALVEMKSALNEYVTTTGDTNILTGSIENVANKIGVTSDPKLAAIKTRIIQATQKYRNAITGAAWGDQEDAEYKTIFPSITNTSKLNSTIIDTMIPLLQNNERNAIGLFLGGSDVYDRIFGNTNEVPINIKVEITPDDNSIFNSVIKPVTTTVNPPVNKVQEGLSAINTTPSFNFSSFFK